MAGDRSQGERRGTPFPRFVHSHVTWSILPRAICAQWETKWPCSLHLPKEWRPLITTISVFTRMRTRVSHRPLVAAEHGENRRDGSLCIQQDFTACESSSTCLLSLCLFTSPQTIKRTSIKLLGQKCKQTYVSLFVHDWTNADLCFTREWRSKHLQFILHQIFRWARLN